MIFRTLMYSMFALAGYQTAPQQVKPHGPSHASIAFRISNAGIPVSGTIDSVSTQIDFNFTDVDHGYIQGQAYVSSIQTGIAIRDRHLLRGDFFDQPNHPVIFFSSKKIKQTGPSKFVGQFTLSMKKITRTLSIPFTAVPDKDSIRFHAHFKIKRLDFDLGEESDLLDNTVDISIEARCPRRSHARH